MTTKSQLELPSPPTFSQMIEDLESISSDEKLSSLIPRDQNDQSNHLINDYLSGFEHLQRLDASLSAQNDSTHDEFERKLHNIIDQLNTCLNKLQTKSFHLDKK